ncbi:MAG: hypothetical protein B6I20_04425 [Bacteroidetes bacterium 4572_117]|nr:MAG: hypothetical protein B6I20_04425 [Bacteroidetes bacterium 4572_117]
MKQTLLNFISTILLLMVILNNNAQDFEVSPVIMKFNAEPGQTQTIPINIFNHSNKKSSFSIGLSDFVQNKEGKLVEMPTATTEHSLANWISINPPFIEMKPNEQRQIIVSIQAPVGDYSTKWTNIYVRSTAEQTALLADKKVQTGLAVQGQIIVRVYQSPKSNINYRMKITGLSEISLATDSIRRFKAIVDNLGDKISDCKVTLLASDLSTAEEIKLQVIKLKAFPDSQLEIKLQMAKNALPKGKYAIAAILDYGSQSNLEGTQMTITVD